MGSNCNLYTYRETGVRILCFLNIGQHESNSFKSKIIPKAHFSEFKTED